jgi:DNA-binding transcriptional regulator GbsR (MarR family)
MQREQLRFVDDMGQQLAGWGLPRATGRTYGYLLLQAQPVSLDDIAAGLEAAKSGVSVTVRQLLALGLVRGEAQRGSRRLLYEAMYDLEAMLAARSAQMIAFVERLRQGAEVAPPGRPRQRLDDMAATLQDLMGEIEALSRRSRERRRAG